MELFVCQCGWKVRAGPNVEQNLHCPRCSSVVECKAILSETLDPTEPASDLQSLLRNLWHQLHQFPIDHLAVWNEARASAWYQEWQSKIPAQGCNCAIDWLKLIDKHPPNYSSADAFFQWTVDRHNDVNYSLGKPLLMAADARKRYRFPAERGRVQSLIKWHDFTNDTLRLTQQILEACPDVSGIAGCPRSGMRAAAEISMRADLPLYEASVEHGLRRCSGGSRLHNADVHGPRTNQNGPVVIVEDSTCSGNSVLELRQHPELKELPIFAVYAGNLGRDLVNGYAVSIDLPHWFEWNFFNNGQILRDYAVGIDWDGVLNEDCSVSDDDDGVRYRSWMDRVRPIRFPRAYQVPFIVTARREAYRSQCETWLRRHRINYGKLVMFPGSFKERARTDIGKWKAEQCDQHGVGLFVESSVRQAHRIAQIRRRLVLCTEASQY